MQMKNDYDAMQYLIGAIILISILVFIFSTTGAILSGIGAVAFLLGGIDEEKYLLIASMVSDESDRSFKSLVVGLLAFSGWCVYSEYKERKRKNAGRIR